ncbi:hypothetical protein [Falsirhodobacter sp. 20TX0035]|uniref:hypothetical protein n=1 Tax=Falsirhodobacter sp. 20TX0035 TaxID=3022019 RepID=UPI00232BEB74|nr:hypothetical protein [Falsirhodobacter sp. 20TX0035]MDB6454846.1 hypothetical protein [Falsirhodobacter sp. 20TX0035]
MGLLVYYDPDTGAISYTLRAGVAGFAPPPGTRIEVETDNTPDPQLWKVEGGQLMHRGAEVLPRLRAEAVAAVNERAGLRRSSILTLVAGQDVVYREKEAEAAAWVAASPPDLSDFPLIAAEIGITGEDGHQVAQVILNRARLDREALAVIETVRLTAIAAIGAAEDEAAIAAAVGVFDG